MEHTHTEGADGRGGPHAGGVRSRKSNMSVYMFVLGDSLSSGEDKDIFTPFIVP